jgi:hypothetical protein
MIDGGSVKLFAQIDAQRRYPLPRAKHDPLPRLQILLMADVDKLALKLLALRQCRSGNSRDRWPMLTGIRLQSTQHIFAGKTLYSMHN